MLFLVIVTLCLALVSIAMGLILVFRIAALFGEMEHLAKRQGELENDIKGLSLDIDDLEMQEGEILECVVYDKKTRTLTVEGNIYAQGWIAFGKTTKED